APMPSATAAASKGPDPGPFRGLGAWVDVFDYAARLQAAGHSPTVTAAAVTDMARLGGRTLYLPIGRDDPRPSTQLVDDAEVRAFVGAAHRAGLLVVAWYLPSLVDIAADFRPVEGIANLVVDGRGFDGIALDMESSSVSDFLVRGSRLVKLTKQV